VEHLGQPVEGHGLVDHGLPSSVEAVADQRQPLIGGHDNDAAAPLCQRADQREGGPAIAVEEADQGDVASGGSGALIGDLEHEGVGVGCDYSVEACVLEGERER